MPIPTPPTEIEWQLLVVATVGDLNGVVAANVAMLWRAYGQYEGNPTLHFLRTKRSALDLLAGAVWQQVTKAVGPLRIDYSDRHKALIAAMADVDKEILAQQRGASAAVVGVMTATQPIMPGAAMPALPYGTIDRGDSRYIGDPTKGRNYPPY